MSAPGSALAQLKPFSLRSRSLFVKCVPAPKSFYERRAVLAALQKSSQQSIETFKKLKDNSSFIAVTTRPDVVKSLLDNSPLERIVISQDLDNGEVSSQSAWGSEIDVSGPIAPPVNPLPADPTTKPTPASANLGLSHKTFTLHIFPANATYNHNEEVRKNALHGKWPGDGTTETFISAALQRVIPSGAMAPGLRDWETGNQLARESDSFADSGREGAASMLLGRKRLSAREVFLMERIRRRNAARETPKVMRGLMQFAEDCRTKSQSPRAQSEPLQSTTTRDSLAQADNPFHDTTRDSLAQADNPFLDTTSVTKPEALLDNTAFKKLLEE
ncbi:hypothetical protein HD806DRAFT_442884 [Xylariaceae sp. AK1471]|nr:hypothetical protein HD806DRAFT_442884 [Xylariaceae sp. AK1471]